MSDMQVKKLQGQEQPRHIHTKSENGASTNLSEGSNDTFEDQLKPKKGQKFEYINQQSQNWPQWSVTQNSTQVQTKTDEQTKQNNQVKAVNASDYFMEHEFMYSRGMSSAMRKKMRERYQQQQKQKQQQTNQPVANTQQNTGLVNKIKNWFGSGK